MLFPLLGTDTCPPRQLCCGNRATLEKVLSFGRDLQNMSLQLKREHGKNEANKKALQVTLVVRSNHANDDDGGNDNNSWLCNDPLTSDNEVVVII